MMRAPILFAAAVLALGATGARAQDKVTYLTNWLAQAEHGGFYQALADGTYAAHGLEVTIRQGGPQSAGRALLVSGQVEFYMGGAASAIDGAVNGVPTVTLAALFQKDPQVMLVHPDSGIDSFGELHEASKILISAAGTATFWQWMKQDNPALRDEQVVPYTFSPAPFIADRLAAQQGFVTAEPFVIERAAGFSPRVFLLADQGYNPYSTTITAMQPWVEANPDIARRFVEASILGWYNYLYDDNSAANALIKAENPDMTDEQLQNSLVRMKEHGIVVSGDAVDGGIGCMTDARWREFYETGVGIGLFPPGLDYTEAYDARFVCKGLGTELVK